MKKLVLFIGMTSASERINPFSTLFSTMPVNPRQVKKQLIAKKNAVRRRHLYTL